MCKCVCCPDYYIGRAAECDNDCCEGECRRENPALVEVKNLISQRDEALEEHATVRKAHAKLVEDLATIAGLLKCEPSLESVKAKLVEARIALSENEALRVTLKELEVKEKDYAEAVAKYASALAEREQAYADLVQEVEHLQSDATLGAAQGGIGAMITLLAKDIKDPGAAKNYVEMKFAWDEGVMPQMPFRQAAITFFREGGKSPHDLVAEAQAERDRWQDDYRRLHKELRAVLSELT